MTVSGQRVREFVSSHRLERDAISQRPFFVIALREKTHALIEKVVRIRQYSDLLLAAQSVQKRNETCASLHATERIACLGQNPSSRDNLSFPSTAKRHGSLVIIIAWIEQRDEKETVAKGTLHFP